jgi:hypothetical protein
VIYFVTLENDVKRGRKIEGWGRKRGGKGERESERESINHSRNYIIFTFFSTRWVVRKKFDDDNEDEKRRKPKVYDIPFPEKLLEGRQSHFLAASFSK